MCKKIGKRAEIQRYLYINCNKTFSSKRRPNKLKEVIFKYYFEDRYTLTDLSKKYSHSREWIQDKIHKFNPQIKIRNPREITAVIDATFFGKREDKFGLIVAKDVKEKEPIAYNFIEQETNKVIKV